MDGSLVDMDAALRRQDYKTIEDITCNCWPGTTFIYEMAEVDDTVPQCRDLQGAEWHTSIRLSVFMTDGPSDNYHWLLESEIQWIKLKL